MLMPLPHALSDSHAVHSVDRIFMSGIFPRLFSKGLPGIALAQVRQAGDLLERIPPGPAVSKYLGFTHPML